MNAFVLERFSRDFLSNLDLVFFSRIKQIAKEVGDVWFLCRVFFGEVWAGFTLGLRSGPRSPFPLT